MEVIGWIGTALIIIAYYPQIHHLRVEKCAWGISITTWVIWLVASVFLLAYAIAGKSTLFVVVQSINMLAVAATIILAKRANNICPFHAESALRFDKDGVDSGEIF